ncbi:family 20 glycosylhydrolase [Opitutus sp. GAS368]|jgi:hexosaminidase|uniref:beta-N-acetylhexosaminidase n=1 Tax=Opitutus sp. GAS368 TaxID=1882749 RepID=UPI00087A1600|nr:family 20 glycosylhydrolase [Opitutus sp. GAS368]SDR81202.1 hexosaminidase [Opitutus sp. GAS368]
MSNFEPRRDGRFPLRALAGLLLISGCGALSAAPAGHNLMPAPESLQYAAGRLAVTPLFRVAVHGHDDARLRDGLFRLLRAAEERTGLTFPHTLAGGFALAEDATRASLVIECGGPAPAVPALGEDESYTLGVTATQAVLQAPTVTGVLRGCATLQQLLQADSAGWFLPAVSINDHPRFPWRGLMIDVCRHWQPLEVIKRNLDGMALVKLNVLHLHLTENQGFRIESRKFPRLHELGSDGLYFTQQEMREIIAYAAARGIRVVPEFDIPGHATAWVVGHPELASAPGPYVIEREWGVFDPVLDPTNPRVYEVLDGFLGEMAALFPDPYIHIGGDENNGVQWNASPRIQTYIKERNLRDNAGLHAYFNTRVHAILAKYGKQLIGWDEILHPDLPAGSVVHSWRGPEGIADATKHGFETILSNGYYIDLNHPGWEYYLNDPVPAGTALTAAQQKLVLGGEATMWSEWVTPETIDSRIWPRTAAIAERLWSPREVRDVPDMYRRLGFVSRRLEETGLRHESYLEPALRRLAGDQAAPAALAALRDFVDLLEPVRDYQRGRQQPGANQLTPLTDLVDCTRPDGAAARAFAAAVEACVFAPAPTGADFNVVSRQLAAWQQTAGILGPGLAGQSPRLLEAAPLVRALGEAGAAGRAAVQLLVAGQAPAAGWLQARLAELDLAAQPHAAAELSVMAPLRLLVVAAAEQDQRKTLGADAWRRHVQDMARPAVQP